METITQERLKELFDYHPSGKLVWRVSGGGKAPVGSSPVNINQEGYKRLQADGRQYKAHRLVFLWHHGYLPPEVDHINCIRSDNRIENLRAADNKSNTKNALVYKNNTSGIKGVSWKKKSGKWYAYINSDGKRRHLGYFENLLDAAARVISTRKQLHGEFARNF
jgi:hypothetical protein